VGVTGSAAISGLPPAGGTGYEGLAASSPQGPLPAPPLLFAKGEETRSHSPDADFRRGIMEQACKRSSSHEGGLMHDPLHKGTCFPSVPQKDREDGCQWVSAKSDVPISG
jgi:hypothetical protein